MQKIGLLLCLSLSLTGCGEFSYKRGATGKDLADTKKLCQSEKLKTDVEVNECLAKNGWTVHQLNDMDLFAVASATSNKQNGSASEDFPALVSPEKVEEKTAAVESSSVANESTPAKPSEKKPAKAQVKSANPLDTYNISSWWKMGTNRANLETDMQSCETDLGAAHKPDHKTQTFTLGMIVCMHQKGWKALKK